MVEIPEVIWTLPKCKGHATNSFMGGSLLIPSASVGGRRGNLKGCVGVSSIITKRWWLKTLGGKMTRPWCVRQEEVHATFQTHEEFQNAQPFYDTSFFLLTSETSLGL